MAEFMSILIKKLCIRSSIISFIIISLIICIAPQALAESTVYGHVYDWSTFDVINYSIVVVDTAPAQKVVTTDGSYTLKMPEGNYTISATSGYGSQALYGCENISVQDNGEYKIDLLLFPDNNITALEAFGQNLPGPTAAPPVDSSGLKISGLFQDNLPAILGLAAFAVLGIIGVVLWQRRNTAKPVVEDKPEDALFPEAKQEPILADQTKEVVKQACEPVQLQASTAAASQSPAKPAWEYVLRPDCRSVLAVIEKNGGRITQLDLRKALPYSEAKISLMISELEDAGYLKKIKRGRGNVLILNHFEESTGSTERPEK